MLAARYPAIGPARGGAGAFISRAVDRRTGAAVVIHRRCVPNAEAWRAAARRRAHLDHPGLAPVLDAGVEGDEFVYVEADVGGWYLADARAAGPLADVLGPVGEALAVLHGHGLAHGSVGADTVAVVRLAPDVEHAVLLGPPDPTAVAGADRRQFDALVDR